MEVTIRLRALLYRLSAFESEALQEAKPEPRNPEALGKGTQKIASTTRITISAKILCDKIKTFGFASLPEYAATMGATLGPYLCCLKKQLVFILSRTAGDVARQGESCDGHLFASMERGNPLCSQAHGGEYLVKQQKRSLMCEAIPEIPILSKIEFTPVSSCKLISVPLEHYRSMVRNRYRQAPFGWCEDRLDWRISSSIRTIDPEGFPARPADLYPSGAENALCEPLQCCRLTLQAGWLHYITHIDACDPAASSLRTAQSQGLGETCRIGVDQAEAGIAGKPLLQHGISLKASIGHDQALPGWRALLMGNTGQRFLQFAAGLMGADHHGDLHIAGNVGHLLALAG